jgi:hypothetical protein
MGKKIIWNTEVKIYKIHQNTSVSDYFWKLRSRKNIHRFSVKHISKSKYIIYTRFGPLLEIEMSKTCTPLWREIRFENQKCKKLRGTEYFWKLRCWKSIYRWGTKYISKSLYNIYKIFQIRIPFGGQISKKYTAL